MKTLNLLDKYRELQRKATDLSDKLTLINLHLMECDCIFKFTGNNGTYDISAIGKSDVFPRMLGHAKVQNELMEEGNKILGTYFPAPYDLKNYTEACKLRLDQLNLTEEREICTSLIMELYELLSNEDKAILLLEEEY